MTSSHSLFRIAPDQSIAAKSKQALMIAASELKILIYREPYQLGDVDQRNSLLHTLNTEFDETIPLPAGRGVFYLIVVEDPAEQGEKPKRRPVLIPENDVQAFVVGYAIAKVGIERARRVSYCAEMLPAAK